MTRLALICTIALSASTAHASTPNAVACEELLDQATTRMLDKQYPTMLNLAEDRQHLCPGALSDMLVGIATGHVWELRLTNDPAALELLRQKALSALMSAAAAGGDELTPSWRMTVSDWRQKLERHAPQGSPRSPAPPQLSELPEGTDEDLSAFEPPPPKALASTLPPPPAPRAGSAIVPIVTASAGAVALASAVVTALLASSRASDADDATDKLAADIRAGGARPEHVSILAEIASLEDDANTLRTWTGGLLIGGGAAITVALIHYFVFEPKGGWYLAATPTNIQATILF